MIDTLALSARVGNLADNCAGGWYGHRAAKTTLNRVIRTTAIEHAGRHRLGVCVAIHPETLVTPLSQPFVRSAFSARLFTPAIAAGHSLRVLEGLSLSGDRRVLRLGRIGNPW